MSSKTKSALAILIGLLAVVSLGKLLDSSKVLGESVSIYTFDIAKKLRLENENSPLGQVVQKNLSSGSGTYGIYIESLEYGEKYLLNPEESFETASLYKLVAMAAVLEKVDRGEWKLEDKVRANRADLVKIFGGLDFGYESSQSQIVYSLDEALIRVGRISDNFAAIMLTQKLRQEGPQDPMIEMARSLGMESTRFGDDSSTNAEDMAVFLKALYKGEIVSKTVSEKLSEYLSLSKINDRIPALLPPEIKVVHKTGELSRLRHDVGIVYLDNSPYIIILLSKELKDEDEGVKRMAQISKDVYEYFLAKMAK